MHTYDDAIMKLWLFVHIVEEKVREREMVFNQIFKSDAHSKK